MSEPNLKEPDTRPLRDDELKAVNGGSGLLESALSEVVKSIGEGLASVARK
jgi:hypothetical protein